MNRVWTRSASAAAPPRLMDAALMDAAVVTGAGRVTIERARTPEPGPGEVRIKLEGCGVCASNLGPWSGPPWMAFPTAPGELGHEAWGVVDAVGSDVRNFAPGDRVAALTYRGYAQYDLAAQDAVVKLPSALAGKAVPGEPLACAVNVLRRSEIAAGQTVAVIGVGFLGALLVQLAVRAGARVLAISRRATARGFAERFGAAATISLGTVDQAADEAQQWNCGSLFDRVIEATGVQAGLDLGARLARERGRLVIAGYHQDGPRSVDMQLWNWRGLDVVNAHERDPAIYVSGMREAIELLRAGALEVDALLTHAYPLERLGEALDATRDRPDGFMKAVIRYT